MPMPSPGERREAKINRKAAANFAALHTRLVSLKGHPTAYVRALNEAAGEFPRLNQFRLISEHGGWINLGSGARGDTVIDFLVWLAGDCERSKAVDFLEDTLVELNAELAPH